MEKRIGIVIADADELFCARLRDALRSANDFRLLGMAKNGGELCRLLGRRRPQVVIADAGLPGLDLLACAAHRPRVLLLSAFYSNAFAARARTQDVDLFLAKPCKIDALLARCRALCKPDAACDAAETNSRK